ncbi:SDR family NAD(P)-dependent oxidoreductase [Bradyrhizobium sp. CIAT3101]|uniref:type I polyketide synthase n=1 Tax=Bradyrhizobium sp. CIAT3101 TaxID=439387 RepID=UPI0024B2006B|nr:type I polyketide synthase [Bradyrhizobium sp. CIAT3101]WFU79162.1 SDR family NAD(P)-dependent oxidoreductase [Bradyrhizobium sp. CIAT3101]
MQDQMMSSAGESEREASSIAIIGMAGRFPGAPSVATFWENIREGRETIRIFTEQELLAVGESPELLRDASYVKACGYLDGIDQFDAAFFGISPRDAAVFDPQHRLFLECSSEAFEDAGYVSGKIGGPVAVFAASGASEYFTYNLASNEEVMRSIGAWLLRHMGNDPNFLATRVSYELDLVGPSMNVQTACSSSLVAVHLACQSLLNGECDVALAGASTIYPDQRGYLYRPGEILSPDGHCRPFDAQAGGTVMASAVGCVVLKRLSDALRDGDCIRAVIRGSAINNDGSDKVGYLAPSVSGQARVISEALDLAGITPEEVSYIEAHGTGTLIGDPIEIAALIEAFGPDAQRQSCAIGSVKSNIGHAGEAAGMCSLIKTICALEHRELPATLHYQTPNPQVGFSDSPFFVNASLRPWPAAFGRKRIAGVTSLGAGGTNAHLILEEAPPRSSQSRRDMGPQLILLSSRTSVALDEATRNLANHLRTSTSQPLNEVAFTLMAGREAFEARRSLVAYDPASAAAQLDTCDPQRVVTGKAAREHASTVFLFPGGGAQYAGMGAELYQKEPVFREAIDACLAVVQPRLTVDLRSLIFPSPGTVAEADKQLEAPSLALPALFAVEYALATLLQSWGLVPTALIGHSAGEYAAACVSGVLTMPDAMSLVALRGKLFETLPCGAMLSVALSEEQVRPRLGDELSLAAVNGPSLCVASGPVDAIARLEAELAAEHIDHTRIHINVAAHSSMLEPILSEFEHFCRTIRFQKPTIPFVSNLSGTWITDAEAMDSGYWVRHLRNTVRFDQGARTVLGSGSRALLEVGPGRTLASLCRQQPIKAAVVTTSLRHPNEAASDVAFLKEAVGRLWVVGIEINPFKFFARDSQRRLPLPTYPFERQRYWIEKGAQATQTTSLTRRPEVGRWFSAPTFVRSAPSEKLSEEELRKPWLVITDNSPLATAIVKRLRASGARVATITAGSQFAEHGALSFTIDPARATDYSRLMEGLRRQDALPAHIVHLWALAPRPRRFFGSSGDADLAAFDDGAVRNFYGLLFLLQALTFEVDRVRLTAIGTAIEALPGEREVHPEKSNLMGVCRVLPREMPGATCSVLDVVMPQAGSDKEALLANRLIDELYASKRDPLVILRDGGRWVQRFDPLVLNSAPEVRSWLRPGGVYLVTGGLGGIGLELMQHLALHAKARLVCVGRTKMPTESAWDQWLQDRGADDNTSRKIEKVRALRALGAEVMLAAADVTDRDAMANVVADATRRFGRINGVFHCAGVLKDQLIALRAPEPQSAVLSVKAKGALILQSLFRDGELDVLINFSSVSSILGLAGQADYTAANAVLDAMAKARTARGSRTRIVSINWNAWKEVGMLATLVHAHHGTAVGDFTSASSLLGNCVRDSIKETVFRSLLHPKTHWPLGEHVVKEGQAVIPGTGFLELARAALAYRAEDRPIDIRDLTFLQPFVVGPNEARAINIKLNREGDHSLVIYGDSSEQPYVTARATYVDLPTVSRRSVSAIRGRCRGRGEVINGRLVQNFMDFGPRWANLRAINLGDGEALIDLALPTTFASDLATYSLHPALLDMATGAAQQLIPGFSGHSDFYVPFFFGRVLVRRPVPATFSSHVRLKAADGKSAVFDVTLLDDEGNELVSIERFVMRRVEAFATTLASRTSVRPDSLETAEESFLREGMTTAEGLEALDRILAYDVSPQIVASTLDLDLWLERLDHGGRGTPAEEVNWSIGQPGLVRPGGNADLKAPRDATERDLAAIWQEMLGIHRVSIDDDFFELGGQSLIAMRLFNRIRKEHGVELPLSVLFQAPTIAATAVLLREAKGLAAIDPSAVGTGALPEVDAQNLPSSHGALATIEHEAHEVRLAADISSTKPPIAPRSLVEIARGGDRPPLFCVHGAGGNVLNFRDLSWGLHHDQPFYALQARGVDGTSSLHTSIEDMARAYIEEIRTLRPHGPYLLAGYSGGGVVAFEMAQQLTAQGEQVPILVFFDTFHPQMPIRKVSPDQMFLRLRNEGLEYIKEIIRKRSERADVARERLQIRMYVRGNKTVPHALRDRQLTDNFGQAAACYRPQPWQGKAILFRAKTVPYIYGGGGPCYGWDSVIMDGLKTIMIPGNHDTLLLGANAKVLMGPLNAALDEAGSRKTEQSLRSERSSV